MFKALFASNPAVLRGFLRDVLEIPLTEADKVTVLNPELIPVTADGKLSRLDIHVELPDRKFNVEMQARRYGFSAERVLYYWAKMFDEDLPAGSHYDQLAQTYSVKAIPHRAGAEDTHTNKVCVVRFFVRLYRNDAAGLAPSKEFLCKMTENMQVDSVPSRQAGFVRCCLNVLGFRMLDCEAYHSSYSILEDVRHELFTNKLSIHIFELPKLPKNLVAGDEKCLWLELIKADSKEALQMIGTATSCPEIRQGIEEINKLNADTILREQIRMREKTEHDYEYGITKAIEEGQKRSDEKTRLMLQSMGFTDEQIAVFFEKREQL